MNELDLIFSSLSICSTFHSSAGCTFVINFAPKKRSISCTYAMKLFNRTGNTSPHAHSVNRRSHYSNHMSEEDERIKKKMDSKCFSNDANLIHKINFFNKIISVSI